MWKRSYVLKGQSDRASLKDIVHKILDQRHLGIESINNTKYIGSKKFICLIIFLILFLWALIKNSEGVQIKF